MFYRQHVYNGNFYRRDTMWASCSLYVVECIIFSKLRKYLVMPVSLRIAYCRRVFGSQEIY